MNNLTSKPFLVILTYLILIGLVFGLHFMLAPNIEQSFFFMSYAFNAVLTLIYLVLLLMLGQFFKSQIGFMFLGVATLKIIIFLIIKSVLELEIERSDFLIFFIPYFLSIIFEILITKRVLDEFSFEDQEAGSSKTS